MLLDCLIRIEPLKGFKEEGRCGWKRCAIYDQAGDCVMPKEGIFTRDVH